MPFHNLTHSLCVCCVPIKDLSIYLCTSVYCYAELAEVLHRRIVIIRGLTMEEFAHQRLLEIMSRSSEFRVNFVFKDSTNEDVVPTQNKAEALWEG